MSTFRSTAPKPTTTLRIPVELRDEIAELAGERETSMVEVVSEAVRQLQLTAWWSSVQTALDDIESPDEIAYRQEAEQFDRTATDGLDDR